MKKTHHYVLAFIPIFVLGIAFIAINEHMYRLQLVDLRDHFIKEQHQLTKTTQRKLETTFTLLYQNLRTIARLPGIRQIDLNKPVLDANTRQVIQEIYNNMASNIDMSEVYIVQKDFIPETIDKRTLKTVEPLFMYDKLIINRNASSTIEHKPHATLNEPEIEEIEIYEYRLLQQQLGWLKENRANLTVNQGLDYPALSGHEVITCDNTRFHPGKPDDKDRSGLVYSVPFYDNSGKLKGVVSGIVLSHVLREYLTSGYRAIHNSGYDYTILPAQNTALLSSQSYIEQNKHNPELVYSEHIRLNIVDDMSPWYIWAGVDNNLFWNSSEVRAETRLRNQILVIGLLVIILLLMVVFYIFRKQLSVLEQKQKLEKEVKQRTEKLELAMRDAQQAAVAKSEFLATMSHEIRTPMNGVLGMAEILSSTQLNNEQKGYLQTLTQSGKSLLNIINDILDFSKIESGKLELENIDFDLEEVAYDVCMLLAAIANEKGIELILDYEQDCPRYFKADPGRIRQIMMNLVGNAIKFTEQGHVLIHIKRTQSNDTGTTIDIDITDTGIGISEEQQKNLFSAFTQADSSTTRKFGGTGLGLSISKQLVEIMQGKLGVYSSPGQGSTFWFRLPLVTTNRPQSLARASLKEICTLVVDDNHINCQVLEKQLTSFDMQVECATSMDDAFALLKSGPDKYQLVITDYLMPVNNGVELNRRMKADPQLATIPVVLYSSAAMKGEAAAFEKEGFSGYITKPVMTSNLYDILASVIGICQNRAAEDADTPIVTKHLARERHPEQNITGLSGKILLAEDNIVNQKVAQVMLLKLGVEIDIANDGLEAVEQFRQQHYDMILMDIQMPEMDGLAATCAIRNIEKAHQHTPIIALTANAMKEDREKYLVSGMDDFLAKPFSQDAIYQLVKKWLKQRDTDIKHGT